MKKVLVTGATGFIGNYVVQELLRNNCAVIATSTNEKKAIKTGWFERVTYSPFFLKNIMPMSIIMIFSITPMYSYTWHGKDYRITNLPFTPRRISPVIRHF